MNVLTRLIRRLLFCTRNRHQWGKPKGGLPDSFRHKQCRNCPAIRAVNTRKRKAAP